LPFSSEPDSCREKIWATVFATAPGSVFLDSQYKEPSYADFLLGPEIQGRIRREGRPLSRTATGLSGDGNGRPKFYHLTIGFTQKWQPAL
jgi:hypothetical protein